MEYLLTIFVAMVIVSCVEGHGWMVYPPARASMWRYNFNTPKNTNDMALDCGGQGITWDGSRNDDRGHCGVCGDPYYAPIRDNEAGGKYATGTIAAHFREGQTITVLLKITVAHGGWSEFRICPNNNIHRAVTQECLDMHLLKTVDGSTRFYHPVNKRQISVRLVLPADVTCDQCVFQWWWKTDANNNCRPSTGENCCIACGRQEIFVNCADVSITPIRPITNQPPTNAPIATRPPQTQVIPAATTTTGIQRLPDSFIPVISNISNTNVGTSKPSYTAGFLPIDVGSTKCIGTSIGRRLYGAPIADRWCQAQCKMGICPASLCDETCRI